jgi:hypothetical protein
MKVDGANLELLSPSFGFLMLEVFINFAMMGEVGIRLIAKGKVHLDTTS